MLQLLLHALDLYGQGQHRGPTASGNGPFGFRDFGFPAFEVGIASGFPEYQLADMPA